MEEPVAPRSPFSTPRSLRTARMSQRVIILPGAHPDARVRIALGGAVEMHKPPNNNNWSPDRQDVISLGSIGMGSTDGRKMTVRKVPTTPTELLNITTTSNSSGCDNMSTCSSYTLSEEWDTDDIATRKRGRDHWANKVQFILACVGYSVGLGNLWRFPYLCYASGGGVFLIPYYLILFTCGVPLLYMELAVGQFTKRGPIGAFSKMCPIFKGAGLSSVVVAFFMSTYYNVIIAYALFYFFTAFRSDAPWSECSNMWNSELCWYPGLKIPRPNNSRTPSEDFYIKKVLQMSSGIENPGSVRWELAACLICAWILVYFALWKSVRSSGRVLYFTATLPFVLVLAFLGRSLTLDGAQLGLEYLFNPKLELLADAKVWVYAAAQNFNSIGIAFGSVISFASYNRSNNRILVDTITVSTINAVTSLIVGVFVFATIGNIAMEHATSVEDVIADGPGLVFVIYPQAMSKMPFSSFWAVLFFFMLLCLGLNSQFALVEVVVTSFQDGFPNWIKKKLVCHELLVLVVCCISFILGLPHITQGGIYFFQLVDHYAVSNSVMCIAFFEVIAIAWCYGAERLSKNIHRMSGERPYFYFKVCWSVAAPSLILCLWIFSIIDYEPPKYNNGMYTYPWWAEVLGWFITASCLLCIPILAVYVVASMEGKTLWQKIKNSIIPSIEDIPPPINEEESKEMNSLLAKPTIKIIKSKSLDNLR
ncbi:sodium- and chloride-dependent GABA transporter ine isoform X2 [Cimex lectularius]|uniref:Transporter n=1 Tax=Cimex lectularius TaxID=79782 RepID=A0A8I6RZT0_CIMLE|nr:sodium- and chloride-dependent GABA transporter ine isoform X2 [Cimex lectularius]